MRGQVSHQSLHEALKVDVVSKHSVPGLEFVVVRLQRSRTDIQYTLHARPSLFSFSRDVSPAHLLYHFGFSVGDCPFMSGQQCLAKAILEEFDVPAFAKTL